MKRRRFLAGVMELAAAAACSPALAPLAKRFAPAVHAAAARTRLISFWYDRAGAIAATQFYVAPGTTIHWLLP